MGNMLLFATAQYNYSTSMNESSGNPVAMLLWAVLILIMLAATWRMYQKAKQPGWAVLIPIYNTIVYLRLASRPWWWIFLLLIPIVNIVVFAVTAVNIAKAFGKSTAFGIVGLWLFAPIGTVLLGFGDAKFRRVTRK